MASKVRALQSVAPEERDARSTAHEVQAARRKKRAWSAKLEAEHHGGGWLLVITLPVEQRSVLGR